MATAEKLDNTMDKSFKEHFERRYCFNAMNLPYELRCEYVRTSPNCRYNMNFVSYIELLACSLQINKRWHEYIALLVLCLIISQLMLTIAVVADKYFAPVLKVIARMLHMNEHLAGVTFLAFGNSSADLFSLLSSLDSGAPMFANTLSGALVVVMVSGGIVSYISPFQLNPNASVRDLLFFIMGVQFLHYIITDDSHVSPTESIFLLCIYFVYLIINILDLVFVYKTVKVLQEQLNELRSRPAARRNIRIEHAIQTNMNKLVKEAGIETKFQKKKKIPKRFYHREPPTDDDTVDVEAMRYAQYSPTNSRNRNLFWEFFDALNPIDMVEWSMSNWLERTFMIIKTPITLICKIFIIHVDDEEYKHGWSKLLNCMQLIIMPMFACVIFMYFYKGKTDVMWWYLKIDPIYLLYPLPVCVPAAIAVLIHARTDLPPPYHFVFAILSITTCLLIIFICATEIGNVMNLVGTILQFSEGFMGATISAFASSVGDLVINVAMALHGYGQMAFAGSIGGPFFSLMFSIGLIFVVKSVKNKGEPFEVNLGNYGQMACVFLLMSLMTTLFWALILNFQSRRSVGIYSILVYSIYMLFAILAEAEVIHTWADDKIINIPNE